jgi:hypothetical protein
MSNPFSKGTTLIETLVAVAITLVVGGAVTAMVLLGSRGSSGIANFVAFDDMINQIRLTMRGDAACASTVGPVGMVTLSAGQRYGDPLTGASVPAIYNVDGTTVFIGNGGTYNDLTKIQLQLYDLGVMDTATPLSNVHIAALYIGATRNMKTAVGPPQVGTTIYIPVTVGGSNSCPYAVHIGNPIMQNVAAAGSNISGMWFIVRAGDANGNFPARPGTIDYAFGTGPVTGAGPVINLPGPPNFDGAFVSTPANTVTTINSNYWSKMIYKQW